jgi:hypothetical protein
MNAPSIRNLKLNGDNELYTLPATRQMKNNKTNNRDLLSNLDTLRRTNMVSLPDDLPHPSLEPFVLLLLSIDQR